MLTESRLGKVVPTETPRLTPRVRRVFASLLGLGIGLIAWFGLLSRFPSIDYRALHGHGDLVQHVCAFAYVSLMALVLWRPVAGVAGILVVAAGLLEIAQIAFPLHQASLLDWAASTCGVAIGTAIFLSGRHIVALTRSRRANAALDVEARND